MGVQTSYNQATSRGIPGGLYDMTPYVVDTRSNEAENGKLLFGMGVVQGSTAGSNINLPATGATLAAFEGVTVNGFTQQHDLEGKISLNKHQSVGVLKQGRIWARLANGVEPAYGSQAYLIISGDEAGLFTNSDSGTLAIKAKFIGKKGTGTVAPIELYGNV